MSKVARWLRERVGRVAVSGSLLPAYKTVYGEAPEISFSDCVKAYLKDPSCKAFVDFLADQIVGMGFYTTVNAEYSQAEDAKRVVDEFCEKVNLDEKVHVMLKLSAISVHGIAENHDLSLNASKPMIVMTQISFLHFFTSEFLQDSIDLAL